MTKCRPEVRQYTYTVMPGTGDREVPYEYTVMVPEQRVRTEQYTVCVPVQRVVEQPYTVMVPTTETRTATRTVCRMVPETVMKTVYECAGHWEERCIEQPVTCAPATCAPATCAPATCAPATCPVTCPEDLSGLGPGNDLQAGPRDRDKPAYSQSSTTTASRFAGLNSGFAR